MPKFKVGDRVELKSPSSNEKLKVGATGTVLTEVGCMYVQWDDFTHGHSNGKPSVPGSSWAVWGFNLKKIKKSTTTKTKETKTMTETMTTKKPGTSHGKPTAKGMKEALKPKAKATVKPVETGTKAPEAPYRPTVGDVVKIVKDTCYHQLTIGSVFTIKKDEKSDIPYYPGAKNNPRGNWFTAIDCELVTKAADVVKAPKESTPAKSMKPKYPAPREALTYGVTVTGKSTKESIKGLLDLTIEIHNGTLNDLATTGTKLDRALVDLKEAKAKIKALEAVK